MTSGTHSAQSSFGKLFCDDTASLYSLSSHSYTQWGQLGEILGGVRFPESGASRWLVQPPTIRGVVSNRIIKKIKSKSQTRREPHHAQESNVLPNNGRLLLCYFKIRAGRNGTKEESEDTDMTNQKVDKKLVRQKQMNINGYKVTLSFSEEYNPNLSALVRSTLLDAYIRKNGLCLEERPA